MAEFKAQALEKKRQEKQRLDSNALLKITFLFSPAGFKGNLSLLDIAGYIFSRGLTKWKDGGDPPKGNLGSHIAHIPRGSITDGAKGNQNVFRQKIC